MRIARTHLKHGDRDGDKRQVAANRLFKMANDAEPGARRLRLVRAGYRALRRAMEIDQTISIGAQYPGWKQLQAYYRKRLDALCAETKEEKAVRKAMKAAERELGRGTLQDRNQARARLLDARIEYARVVGMTLRFW